MFNFLRTLVVDVLPSVLRLVASTIEAYNERSVDKSKGGDT